MKRGDGMRRGVAVGLMALGLVLGAGAGQAVQPADRKSVV